MVILRRHQNQLKERSIIFPLFRSFKKPLLTLTTIHQKYGDLVLARFFKKKLLFVCQPDLIEEVFKLEANGLLNRDFLYSAKKSMFGDGLINSKTETWTNQRRIMQPLFAKETITGWEKIFIDEAESTRNKLTVEASDEVNLSNEIKSLIQRIFVRVLTGKSVNTLKNSDELIRTIETISDGLAPQLISQIISNGKLMWLLPDKDKQYHAAVENLTAFINAEINSKQQKKENSLISLMLQSSDKKTGYKMSSELVKDEAVNLFFTGQDTTIDALLWFFYLIGKNKNAHCKITEEVRQLMDAPLSSENLAKFIYTKATLYEALRLYPPLAGICTQAIENVVIGGHMIKRGTVIIVSTYVTHRHAKLWDRPNELYPEHFLNPKADIDRHKYAFIPFGGGLHNCIGRHFAELEMMIIIITLLRAFTFKTDAVINEAPSITLKPDQDLVVSIIPLP